MLKHVLAFVVFVLGVAAKHHGMYASVLLLYGLWGTDEIAAGRW
jgi:hypothetical protein